MKYLAVDTRLSLIKSLKNHIEEPEKTSYFFSHNYSSVNFQESVNNLSLHLEPNI
jgi:hypothetical protein